jgi:ferredoxin
LTRAAQRHTDHSSSIENSNNSREWAGFAAFAQAGKDVRVTMKVVIDRSLCVGHARCNAVAPDLYPLDDVGYIDSDGFDVPAGKEADARKGAMACPERIIRTIDDPSGKTWPPVKA